ncbi:YncE family protein [Paludibaculum fermentans]|uniref:YncE family protein n=1 Tax=Paludibaculum fermentans TaxID=1473598 RepID=UPI003EBB5230
MISRRSILGGGVLGGAALFTGCKTQPGSGYRGFAFVATAGTPAVAAVDLMAFAVKSRIELPAPPSALLLHPDPGKALIYALAPKSQTLEEIDTKARKRTRGLKLPGVPLSALPQGGKLWCLMKDPAQLTPLDLTSFRPGKPIPLPAPPVAFDLGRQTGLAAVTLEDGSLVLVDLAAGRALPAVQLEPGLGGVRFRSDGKLVIVAESAARRLTFVDPASRAIVTQLPLALSPEHMCMTPDGGQLFLTGPGRDAVVIAYVYRTEIAQTSLSGRRPGNMAISSQTEAPAVANYLFVANPEAGSITVFNVSTQKVVAVTGVGMDPGSIVVTPDQQYALVLNRASGDMAVIRIAAIAPGRAKSAPLFTMIPVGERPVAVVITEAN